MMTKTLAVGLMAMALFVSDSPTKSALTGVAYFRERVVSVSHAGSYPGATQTWRTRVLLLHENRAIGTGSVACIFITNKVRECFGTYVLPQGRIKVLGEITNRTNYSLAIVGGTGIYVRVAGVATFTSGLATFYLS